MTLMELATIAENNLPIKYAILNNNHLGMITQWQGLFYDNRLSGVDLEGSPDFVKLAESYNAEGLRAKTTDELDGVIDQMIKSKKTVIADIWVTKEENCFPMIQSGSAHNEMLLSKDQKQDKKSAEKGKILV